MKTTLYLLAIAAFFSLTACKSVEKLVDQGRYDEAIVLATKKLAGKKNKKTKHIKALEKAFVKVNKKNLAEIARLRVRGEGQNWGQIYDYGQKIHLRQGRILPFLPLISEEGYVGDFEFIDTDPILAEAGSKMAEYLYKEGKAYLNDAQLYGNKISAQKAFNKFDDIGKYYDAYKDVDQLLFESKRLGTFHLLLKVEHLFPDYGLSRSWRPRRLRNDWVQYHTEFSEGIAFDAVSTLYIEDINISPERETFNNLVETKTIERWVDALDQNGNILKDSLGNSIQVKEIENIRARVTEVIRTKDAVVYGRVETVNFITGDIIDEDRYTHEIHFASDACTFQGDRRALSEVVRKRINNLLLPFPTDYDIIAEGFGKMEANFYDHVDRLDLRRYFERSIAAIKKPRV